MAHLELLQEPGCRSADLTGGGAQAGISEQWGAKTR